MNPSIQSIKSSLPEVGLRSNNSNETMGEKQIGKDLCVLYDGGDPIVIVKVRLLTPLDSSRYTEAQLLPSLF